MTTLITRLFENPSDAKKVAERLIFKGVPKRDCRVIIAGDKADALMDRAQIPAATQTQYRKGLKAGKAVLALKATYKPLGIKAMAREMLAKYDTVDVGKAVEESKLAWEPDPSPSILKSHPRFLTLPGMTNHGPVTSSSPKNLVKPHSTKRPLTDKRMSRAFWPMPLTTRKRKKNSAISGGRYMSRLFWPMPLLSRKRRGLSAMSNAGPVFSRALGMKTTI